MYNMTETADEEESPAYERSVSMCDMAATADEENTQHMGEILLLFFSNGTPYHRSTDVNICGNVAHESNINTLSLKKKPDPFWVIPPARTFRRSNIIC
jgi:hypothetical protein